jgi:pyrroloquinoline-quinone synthase
MSVKEIAFFAAHDEIGETVTPINALLLARFDTSKDRQCITRAVRLSHEFEVLFYGTGMAATPTGK